MRLDTHYLGLVQKVLANGTLVGNRTGEPAYTIFGESFSLDISKYFPALSAKELAWKSVVGELLWFLEGSSNVNRLREITHGKGSDKKTIWDANYENQAVSMGYENGELGPVYGMQWRNFLGKEGETIDQIQNVIDRIKAEAKTGVHDRRIIVSAWNPAELDDMALPPCHYSFQFVVLNGQLHLQWNQRSVDVFLGLPFNIASYALLLYIIAQITGLKPGTLRFCGTDVHIYKNHVDACNQMLSRPIINSPKLVMPKFKTLEDALNCKVEDFVLENYFPHPKILAPMAV